MSFTTEIEAATRVLNGGKQIEEVDPSLAAAVHRVMANPQCTITGKQDDVKHTYISTPLIEEGTRQDSHGFMGFPLRIGMDVSRDGLVQIIETMLLKAKANGPLSAEQMVAHIQDSRKYGRDRSSDLGGTYKTVPSWETKKYIQEDLFCPFCKHTMREHKIHGGPASLDRVVRCATCGCDDNAHPALISLKDKAQEISKTIG